MLEQKGASRAPHNGTEERVPELHREGGYIFVMVMHDCNERAHCHVKGGKGGNAKFWLRPGVALARAGTYREHELSKIEGIVRANIAKMLERWDEECAKVAPRGQA